jgi:hypothetical protein
LSRFFQGREKAMEVASQLSIFLENRPGVLARVCEALSEAGVNLRAVSVSDTVDHAVVRLVPAEARRAHDVLERGGALVVETDVLCVRLPNKPGALADLSRKFAKAGVNIEYAYGSAPEKDAEGIVVFRVNDIDKARAALGG